MTEYTLVTVGVEGIQEYIFRSNRLRENIGASYLVYCATERWPMEVIQNLRDDGWHGELRHNIQEDFNLDYGPRIEAGDLDVEVLYTGGGNTVLLFRSDICPDPAQAFIWSLSTRALCEAPGLTLDINHMTVDLDRPGLGETIFKAISSLKSQRSLRPFVVPQLGLGASVMCRSTAFPAVHFPSPVEMPDPYPVSAEVYAKIVARKEANELLRNRLQSLQSEFAQDFEDVSVGEYGLMAVVHADGDRMGNRIKKLKAIPENREYINQMRIFSDGLKRTGLAALEITIKRVENLLVENNGVLPLRPTASKRARIEVPIAHPLPMRPLVFGGDDLTLVCDGRLGISLTLLYLAEFQKQAEIHLRESLTSSAGVAIVKPHYPFARAYKLAADLANHAKQYKKDGNITVGCLDWHFASGAIYDDVEGIRKREYRVPSGNLSLRPVALDGDDIRVWPKIAELVQEFQGEEWSTSRNKLNALRKALRGGPDAVKSFYEVFNRTPKLSSINGFTNGWNNDQCGYYDALELADFYIPLDESEHS
jgi:hypothetical protein